jgi:ADP-ribose pyrophosphatase YjhB (NUDIX family)
MLMKDNDSNYDFAVSAFITHKERLLLLSHKKLNTWINVGGHIEANEDLEMALWREVLEETGLKQSELQLIEPTQKHERPQQKNTYAKILPMPFDITVYFVGNNPHHRHVDFAYLMKSCTDNVTYNKNESNQFGWFNLQELESMQDELFPNVYAQSVFALNQLSHTKIDAPEKIYTAQEDVI